VLSGCLAFPHVVECIICCGTNANRQDERLKGKMRVIEALVNLTTWRRQATSSCLFQSRRGAGRLFHSTAEDVRYARKCSQVQIQICRRPRAPSRCYCKTKKRARRMSFCLSELPNLSDYQKKSNRQGGSYRCLAANVRRASLARATQLHG
jgi:hypothetical protein